jgi:hypothetical protein
MPIGFGLQNLREGDHMAVLGVDEVTMLILMLKEQDGGRGLDCPGLGQVQRVSSCGKGNEPSGSVRCGEFIE